MLRRLLLALTLSTALVAADATPALAGPAIAAVGAFAATPIGGVVADFALGLAFNAAGTLIKGFFSKKSAGSSAAAGIRGTVATGGDVPVSFVMGYRMTAGSLAYRGTWGSAGKTPNAYYVEERILSDLPMPDEPGLWIDDEKVTIDWEATPVTQGYPVLERRVSGVDHAWVLWHDGTQTTADGYMRAMFGSHAERPYGDDMIGRGQVKVIVTTLINRELFRGFPRLKFEVEGIPLYDISKDTTAGGDGLHRINDPGTWEPSDLLPVHIYNALIGVRYDGDWVWGGQNIGSAQLPAASWIAAIAEARAAVDLAGGGTEPQFRGGFEITGTMEPQAVIQEALKGCAGRMAEIGGLYKILVGVPAASVFSFTDRDVIVSREQGFSPWPSLDDTHNAIRASYPEPALGWVTREAPARTSPDLEADDQGRRLAIDTSYEMVFSVTQVQRLMEAAIREARRWRRHTIALPPEASELEPLDVVSWTSTSNSYTAKKLIVTDMDDEPTYLATVSLQEIDPADYDYDAETDELPYSVGTLTPSRPGAQAVADWAVAPYIITDSAGADRRPAIRMTWNGAQPDVRALLYEVRLAETGDLVLSGEFATQFGAGEGVTPGGTLLPDEDYEARGRYDPFSARETTWSSWLAVTTPDVKLGSADLSVELGEIAASLNEQLAWIGEGVRNLVATLQRTGSLIAEQDIANHDETRQLRRELLSRTGEIVAGYLEAIEVATGPASAIAAKLETLYAAAGGNTAEVNIRWEAVAAPDGYSARYAIQAAVDDGTYRSATLFMDVPADPAEKTRVVVDANQFVVTDGSGAYPAFVVEGGELKFVGARAGRITSADGTSMVIDFDDPEILMESAP